VVIIGFTILFGFDPFLKTIIFNEVEQGIEIHNSNKVVKKGIKKKKEIGNNNSPYNRRFIKIARKPIIIDVIISRTIVANTFSPQVFLENWPIIKSLEVLATNGEPMFPRNEIKAGSIIINTVNVSKGKINKSNKLPTKKFPIIEKVCPKKDSLTI